MKIIIVGCGKVGHKLAEKLSLEESTDVTVVDLNRAAVKETANAFDVMGVVGDGITIDTFMEAGIKDTDILIAVTGSDEVNLLICLLAKKLGNCQTIARIRNPQYNESMKLIKDDLGLAMIINPDYISASEIVR